MDPQKLEVGCFLYEVEGEDFDVFELDIKYAQIDATWKTILLPQDKILLWSYGKVNFNLIYKKEITTKAYKNIKKFFMDPDYRHI